MHGSTSDDKNEHLDYSRFSVSIFIWERVYKKHVSKAWADICTRGNLHCNYLSMPTVPIVGLYRSQTNVLHLPMAFSWQLIGGSADTSEPQPLTLVLTHWGRMTHICVSNLTIIGSDNGLSPGRRQAIIRTNAGILLIGPLGTNFSEIWMGIQTFALKKIHLKMSVTVTLTEER